MKFWIGLLLIFTSCSSSILKYDKSETLKQNNEFESQVQIIRPIETDPVPAPPPVVLSEIVKKSTEKAKVKTKSSVVKKKKNKTEEKIDEVKGPPVHLPDIEDPEGFVGRRPVVDPFRVGEDVTMSVRYFKLRAGTLNLKVEPFSFVNGRKSYTFVTEVRTASFFANIYTADDRVEALVDYENLIPHTYSLQVKESGQLREAQCFFDHTKNHATFWEKKYTEKSGHEERKLNWDIQPFSQNVFSAIFYMRTFNWKLGKEIAFRVAHDEENIVFRGKAIREEKLETDAGTFDTIVIKPEFQVKGAFKPVGEIYFWISNDERRYILRIESSIKIGTLVAEAVEIKPGK